MREADVGEEKGKQCLCNQAAPGGGGRWTRTARSREWPWIEGSTDKSPPARTLAQLSNYHLFVYLSKLGKGDAAKHCKEQMHIASFHCGKMNDWNTEEGNLEVRFSGIKTFMYGGFCCTPPTLLVHWSASTWSLSGQCKSPKQRPRRVRGGQNPSWMISGCLKDNR